MKLLLVLEHHFYIDQNGDYYCDRIISNEYLERYITEFSQISIMARVSETTTSSKLDVKKMNKISLENISFIHLPNFKNIKDLVKNMKNIKNKFLKSQLDCDVILMRAPSHLSLFLYRYADKSKLGIEFVMGADKFWKSKNVIGNTINYFIDKEAKKMCKAAKNVSYVTKNKLQMRYPKSKSAIDQENHYYSSINIATDSYYKKRWTFRKGDPIKWIITHTGFMDSDRKGHEIVIEVSKILKEKGLSFEVRFIGDGQLRETLEDKVIEYNLQNEISFLGEIKSQEEVLNLLKQSHLFLLPSKSEGLPRAIIEAMTTSNVCIASNVDGIPELIDEKYLVDNFEPINYAEKIIGITSNIDRLIEESENNYEKSLEFNQIFLNLKREKFYKSLKNIRKEELNEA